MAEHVEDAMRSADAAIAALKKTKPSNAAEARVRAAELMRLNQILLEAGKRVVAANAQKRVASVSNGHAKPVEVTATDLSEGVLAELAKGLVPFIREVISDALAEPIARLAELERRKGLAPLAARLASLENTALKYDGVWNETKAYSAGTLVTFQGGLWHCEDTNCGVRPGAGSSSWRLAVKRGRADK